MLFRSFSFRLPKMKTGEKGSLSPFLCPSSIYTLFPVHPKKHLLPALEQVSPPTLLDPLSPVHSLTLLDAHRPSLFIQISLLGIEFFLRLLFLFLPTPLQSQGEKGSHPYFFSHGISWAALPFLKLPDCT